jgi:hypothetical protein
VEASNGMGCILYMGGNVFADAFSRFDSFGHGVPLNGGRGSAKRPTEILVAGWKRDVCNGSEAVVATLSGKLPLDFPPTAGAEHSHHEADECAERLQCNACPERDRLVGGAKYNAMAAELLSAKVMDGASRPTIAACSLPPLQQSTPILSPGGEPGEAQPC